MTAQDLPQMEEGRGMQPREESQGGSAASSVAHSSWNKGCFCALLL